jgi:D-3-phosphoglycerate dehydrogenase / 2-oxoglutarate reductase
MGKKIRSQNMNQSMSHKLSKEDLFKKNSINILLAESIHPVAEDILSQKGFQVTRLNHALTQEQLEQELPKYQVIGIRSKTEIPRAILETQSHLLMIGCFCIGTNQVDLKAAQHYGIPVFNAPHSNTRSVAELVMAEIICLSRKIMDRSFLAHQGGWLKSAEGSREIRGKTLGIIGYGHIGTQVSVLAEAFGMKVVFYDIIKKLPMGNAQPLESLDDLLAQSDFVTLHVPGTPLTKNLINQDKLKKMKKGSYLLNLSRGDVVDLEALSQGLKTGDIAGAGVDVFPEEPQSNKDSFRSPLQQLPNVILTPHIGGSTEEAQYAIGLEVANSMIAFLMFGQTLGAVNFPQAFLGHSYKKALRIANIHRNQPGALSLINQKIANLGGNIIGQSLVTDDDIGYTLIDIEGLDPLKVEKEFSKELPVSLRTRLLTLETQ